MPEFELLCDELHLTAELEDAKQLERLKHWWQTSVSSDISFKGSSKEEYKMYLNEANRYLNTFISNKFTHMNAIQYAALHGYNHYLAKVNELSDAFSQPDQDGMTPLHWAAYKGHVQTVKTLLKKGADPLKENKHAQLPLYSTLLVPVRKSAALFSHKLTVFKKLLKAAPETINHHDNSGNSVLHLMASVSQFNPLLQDAIKSKVQALSQPNNLKQYPIHTAILNHQTNNARVLLESNSGMDKQGDRENRSALHYAALYGSDELINLCINYSDNINARDTYNKTPLILAAEAGNQEAITALIDHHADQTCLDCNKKNYHDYLECRQQHNF